MLRLETEYAAGVLQQQWITSTDEYPIASAWSPNGALLVIIDAQGSVYTFGANGDLIWKSDNAHEGGALALAMHPNRAVFATTGQDGRGLVWSAVDGELIHTIESEHGWIEHAAWSPNGDDLAIATGRYAIVFNDTGNRMWQTDAHPSTISALAWSPKGELATACYGQVSFFDGASGAPNQVLEWQGSMVSMELSACGDIVACGSQDRTVHFWRRSSGEDSMMHGYRSKPTHLAFDQSSTLLATGGGDIVIVWSFANGGPEGTRPGTLKMHAEPITALDFAPDSQHLASGARDGSVVAWSLDSNGNGMPIGTTKLPNSIAQLQWRPDGRGITGLDAHGNVINWKVLSTR